MIEKKAVHELAAQSALGSLSHPSGAPWSEHLAAGLAQLLRAYDYAAEAGCDLWEFAVEIGELRAAGMTPSDFRWLVAKGYVEHGREISLYGDPHRTFRSANGLNFLKTTAFVLTPAGAARLRQLAAAINSPLPFTGEGPEVMEDSTRTLGNSSTEPNSACFRSPHIFPRRDARPIVVRRIRDDLKPIWEPRKRELYVDGLLVKRFRVPADNQELVLSVFQEENWPSYIDDPLPMSPEIVPKRRLHNVISRLNSHQCVSVLRFHGNGNGEGIGWQFLPQVAAHAGSGGPQRADSAAYRSIPSY